MRYFDPAAERTFEELLQHFENGELGVVIHAELRLNLVAKENELVKAECNELIAANALKGGSPKGFYFRNELYGTVAAISDGTIGEIHESLRDQAKHLRENRTDIPQYTTYLAHFLGYMDTNEPNPVAYSANIISGLDQFSDSLKRFQSHYVNRYPDAVAREKYDRDDVTKVTYFAHYDRVAEPLKRFLFRKLTN
jgi:hypothetical protein